MVTTRAGCACRTCDPRRLRGLEPGAAWMRGASLYVRDARRAEQDAAHAFVHGAETAAWWLTLANRRWAFAVADLLRALGSS